jgi:hypothetical protein
MPPATVLLWRVEAGTQQAVNIVLLSVARSMRPAVIILLWLAEKIILAPDFIAQYQVENLI